MFLPEGNEINASSEGEGRLEAISVVGIEREVEFLEVGPNDGANPPIDIIVTKLVVNERLGTRETHLPKFVRSADKEEAVYKKG